MTQVGIAEANLEQRVRQDQREQIVLTHGDGGWLRRACGRGTLGSRRGPRRPAPAAVRTDPMLANLKTFALVGIDASPVEVEVDASAGLPKTVLFRAKRPYK